MPYSKAMTALRIEVLSEARAGPNLSVVSGCYLPHRAKVGDFSSGKTQSSSPLKKPPAQLTLMFAGSRRAGTEAFRVWVFNCT